MESLAFIGGGSHGLNVMNNKDSKKLQTIHSPKQYSASRKSAVTCTVPNKRMYNPDKNLVMDAIEGVLRASGDRLARLEYTNSIKVVVQNEDKHENLAVLCGGGSGHEPSHAGWVGKGMLSAAVCGDAFASPSTEAVLAGIEAVSGEKGCLVIVMNYTGDRLNFGMAVEKAKKKGIPCRMLIVKDDVSIENAPQPRGIAGTVFVNKIAGAAAEKGYDLEKVYEIASAAAENVYSIGMSMTVCSIPGREPSDRLDGNVVEYGLGIHGEPGVERTEIGSSKVTCEKLVEYLSKRVKDKSKPYSLLVNNLGTLPPLEMSIVVKDCYNALESAGFSKIESISVNTAMTSLNMAGFSMSLLDVSCHEEVRDLLYAPTECLSWQAPVMCVEKPIVKACPPPEEIKFEAPSELTPEGELIKKAIRAAAEAVIKAEPELTKADLIVGDGDCGETLKQGAERILQDLDKMPLNSPPDTLVALGACVKQSMGGTSGVLYSLGFNAAAATVAEKYKSDFASVDWVDCLRSGTEAIMFYGGAKEGMRTMLDALVPAMKQKSGADVAEAAVKGAKSTAEMGAAGAGRSSYIPGEEMKGTADPGATAVGVWLSAIASVL
eukprot:CAMPEP_0182444332 /NCGR_PEP_ID=MMETSP1172-20130603/2817_1 /TAXON_ID=708627 /ORGANISM="Timspurckia oligopyrenoides, Strain CCMP3278" /LENGTH=604 /DNA_ID=CAMNT_0024639867 /DNA_START=206 /DNA_END=2020 /DNA_ORIENTATION=-